MKRKGNSTSESPIIWTESDQSGEYTEHEVVISYVAEETSGDMSEMESLMPLGGESDGDQLFGGLQTEEMPLFETVSIMPRGVLGMEQPEPVKATSFIDRIVEAEQKANEVRLAREDEPRKVVKPDLNEKSERDDTEDPSDEPVEELIAPPIETVDGAAGNDIIDPGDHPDDPFVLVGSSTLPPDNPTTPPSDTPHLSDILPDGSDFIPWGDTDGLFAGAGEDIIIFADDMAEVIDTI